MLQTTIASGIHIFNPENWGEKDVTIEVTLDTSSGDDVTRFRLYGYDFELTKRIEDDFIVWACTSPSWSPLLLYPIATASAFYTGRWAESEWTAYDASNTISRTSYCPLRAIVKVLSNII